jgi:dihydroorotate dehydrogenase
VIKQQPLDLIACGGVLCGDDAYDYLYAEAVAVQCTSGPVWHLDGPRFLVDLVAESEPLQVFIAAYFPT